MFTYHTTYDGWDITFCDCSFDELPVQSDHFYIALQSSLLECTCRSVNCDNCIFYKSTDCANSSLRDIVITYAPQLLIEHPEYFI